MPRSEDYLDSLLDSINEPKKKKKQSRVVDGKASSSEALFLDEFEKELAMEFSTEDEQAFIESFEKELGIEPEPLEAFVSERPKITKSEKDLDAVLESALNPGTLENFSENEEPQEDILSDISEPETKESEEDVVDAAGELMGSLVEILGEEEADYGDIPTTDDSEDSEDSGSEPSKEPTEEPLEESSQESVEEPSEESDVMSDIDEEPSGSDDSEDNDSKEEEPEEGADDSQEDGPNIPEASENDAEEVPEEEILDIGNLLDSIDEEGNIDLPESEQASMVDEEGNPVKNYDDGGENSSESGKDEEKVSFIAKILGIFTGIFKKKDKEEEEDAEGEEDSQEESQESSEPAGESKEDKKKAKKEEKERKKKEKEEAKKKAKEDKDKKKKDKPKKEKKPKKPDNSPKIPIKVLFPFLLLSASLVVLWNVAKNAVGHEIAISSAQSNFDHGEYLDSYRTLVGMDVETLNEEESQLYNRAMLMATLQLRLDTYELYHEKEEIKALDAIVRGSEYYYKHSKDAKNMGIPSEFDALGEQVLAPLESVYGLSKTEVKELMDMRVRSEYTKELFKILERQGLWSKKE